MVGANICIFISRFDSLAWYTATDAVVNVENIELVGDVWRFKDDVGA